MLKDTVKGMDTGKIQTRNWKESGIKVLKEREILQMQRQTDGKGEKKLQRTERKRNNGIPFFL